MSIRALASAGALVALGMLCSRLLGFLREALVAAHYGAGDDASMAIGMLTIPDYIIGLFIGGTLSAALLPALAKRNEQDRLALFWQFLTLNVVIFTLVALVLYSQSSGIKELFHNDTRIVPNIALFWTLISMPLTVASGVVSSWLQYRQSFRALAFAHVVFNFVVVLALWLMPTSFVILGGAIFIGAALRLLLLAVSFCRNGGRLHASWTWQIDWQLIHQYMAALGNSFFSTLPVYAPYFLLPLMGGQLALYNYAFKLIYLPAMLINTIVNVVLLPRYVHQLHAGHGSKEYNYNLTIAFVVSVSIALCMGLAGWHIVALCFGYGEMTMQDIDQVTQLFVIGILALPFMVASYIWQQIFYAHEKAGVPFKVSMVQAVLCIPFMWTGYTIGAEPGVMVSIILLQIFPFILFSYLAERRGILSIAEQYKGLGRMLVAVLLVFTGMAWIYEQLNFSLVSGVIFAIMTGGIMVLAGLAVNNTLRSWFIGIIKRT